jgi:hypothetical protein
MDQQIRNWVFRSLACFVVGIHQLPSGLWGTPDLYQAMWRVDGHQEQLNGVAFSKHVHRPTDWLTVGLGNRSHVMTDLLTDEGCLSRSLGKAGAGPTNPTGNGNTSHDGGLVCGCSGTLELTPLSTRETIHSLCCIVHELDKVRRWASQKLGQVEMGQWAIE